MIKKLICLIIVLVLLMSVISNISYSAGSGDFTRVDVIGNNLLIYVTANPSDSGIKYSMLGYNFSFYIGKNTYSGFISYTGGENPHKVAFINSSNSILSILLRNYTSPLAQEEITQYFVTGGTIYLNAVMTVTNNGVPRGSINSDGTNKIGIVCDTLEGIIGAIKPLSWSQATQLALSTYFKIPVPFNPQLPQLKLTATNVVIEADQTYAYSTVSISIDYSHIDFPQGKTYSNTFKTATVTLEGNIIVSVSNLKSASYNLKVDKTKKSLITGANTVPLNGTLKLDNSIVNDSTTYNVTVKSSTADVTLSLTAKTDNGTFQKQIDGNSDETITVKGIATLKNVTNVSIVTRWDLSAYLVDANGNKEICAIVEPQPPKSYPGSTLTASDTFTFKVVKSKFPTDGKYTQRVKFIATAKLSNNVTATHNPISDIQQCEFYINSPPPPPPPVKTPVPEVTPTPEPEVTPTPTPFIPFTEPVAIITAPATAMVGTHVQISGAESYSPDGTPIVGYFWNLDPNYSVMKEGIGFDYVFSDVGEYNILLGVVDAKNHGGNTSGSITITPAAPTASINITGCLKENRKLNIASISYCPSGYTIDNSKTVFTITPISGGTVSDIKYNGSLTGITSKDCLFKKAGDYKVTLHVELTNGVSDDTEKTFTIFPDISPIAIFSTTTTIIRDIVDGTGKYYATIIVNDGSYSTDMDNISSIKIIDYYDSDNDGLFTDETPTTVYNGVYVSTFSFITYKCGKHQVHEIATEGYGQPTMPEFLIQTDYLAAYFDNVVEVINIAPVVDFLMKAKQKVDITLNVADTPYQDIATVQSKINSIVKPTLLENNIDLSTNVVDAGSGYINSISSGGAMFAIMSDGSVKGWGSNIDTDTHNETPGEVDLYGLPQETGSYGHGATYFHRAVTSPTTLGISNVKQVVSQTYGYGYGATLFLKNDGTVWYTGKLLYGSIRSTVGQINQLPNVSNVKEIAFNGDILLLLMNDGIVKIVACYSSSVLTGYPNIIADYPQYSGYYSCIYSPIAIPNLTGVKHIYMTLNVCFAVMNDGTVKAWGTNQNAGLGMGNPQTYGTYDKLIPTTIPGLNNVKDMYTSITQIYARLSDNSIYQWGVFNWTAILSPTYVPSLNGAISFAISGEDYIALFSNGSILTNRFGANANINVNNVQQVATGFGDFVVVQADGTVKSWGYAFGACTTGLGDNWYTLPSYSNYEVHYPTVIPGLTGVRTKKTYLGLGTTVNTAAWRAKTYRFYVNLNDGILDELSTPSSSISILKNLLSNQINYVDIGNYANYSQTMSLISQNLNNGTYISSGSIDTAMTTLSTHILNVLAGDPPAIYQYAVAGEDFEVNSFYSDSENDSQLSTRYKFTHVYPNYFENGNGIYAKSGQYTPSNIANLPNVGKYEIVCQGNDNPPSPGGAGAAPNPYSLWSLDTNAKLILYVHRRPIAQFTVSFTGKSGANYISSTYDSSYDLDHTNRIDKGIVTSIWKWKLSGDTGWTNGVLPSVLQPNSEYLVMLTVTDLEGASSLPNLQTVTTTGINFAPTVDCNPQLRDWGNTNVATTITASDPDNNYYYTIYQWSSNPAYPSGPWSGADARSSIPLTQPTQGVWYLHMIAYDTLGASFYRVRGPFNIDKTPPTNVVTCETRTSNMEDLIVDISLTDYLSGLKAYSYQWSASVTTPVSGWTDVTISNVSGTNNSNFSLTQNSDNNSWYLYFNSTDIASNKTETIKYGPFIVSKLKLTGLRINSITDFNWKRIFNLENGNKTVIQTEGIQVKDMPVYLNKYNYPIKIGYKVKFKIDSLGLYNSGDVININTCFYVQDDRLNIIPVDIYVKNFNEEYEALQDSSYENLSHTIHLDSTHRYTYEPDSGLTNCNTWMFEYYLPPTTKVVKKGQNLDLFNDNTLKSKLLVVFDIIGKKGASEISYDYTKKETNWGSDSGAIYGKNNPSKKELLDKGINAGEVFWYTLNGTALDDIEIFREW